MSGDEIKLTVTPAGSGRWRIVYPRPQFKPPVYYSVEVREIGEGALRPERVTTDESFVWVAPRSSKQGWEMVIVARSGSQGGYRVMRGLLKVGAP